MKLWLYCTYLIFLSSVATKAYVFQIGDNGQVSKWSIQVGEISFSLDTSGSTSASSSQIQSYALDAATQWNSTNAPNLIIELGSGNELSRNDIVFSNSSLYFSGSSTLAVTRTTSRESDGQILEADIFIKPVGSFNSNSAKEEYFESLMAHEIGHAIGLGHSQIHYSTMFYSLTRGQRTLHSDDLSGANALYGVSIGTGTISGIVAGGSSKIGIFGAHVQAVSSLTGRVVAGAFTEQNGSFSIKNLPLNDVYFLYVEPAKLLSALSDFYKDARSNFCLGESFFRGSFFQICDNSRRGHPQGILLNGNRDVGIITIRCGLDVPVNYLSKRDNLGVFELSFDGQNAGEAMVGFFSESDIVGGKTDKIRIDLSNLNVPTNNFFFEAKLIAQDFYSQVKWDMRIDTPTGFTTYTSSVDSDGNPDLDLVARVALDPLTSGNNVFDLTITPTNFWTFLSTQSFSSEDYFPSKAHFGDGLGFYLLVLNVSQFTASTYQLHSHYRYEPLQDNAECMDAPRTFLVKSSSFIASEFSKIKKKQKEENLACGSIALDGGGSGPTGMFLSLSLGFLMTFLVSRFKYFLVSKIEANWLFY